MSKNESELGPMPPECQLERIGILRSLNSRLKYIRVDRLSSIVHTKLSKPNTALLTSEALFGHKWEMFEAAMNKDSRLKFGHNLFSPEDNTIANRDSEVKVKVNTRGR